MADISDLRATIIPRSDQLNSEQLLGGPMVITVSDVRAGGSEEQPVSVYYATDPARPFKPCKTMRKVLILAWGPDGRQWIGKSMELYCEPSVKFGGEVVGGIRISKLSDIPKEIKVSLTATKGRKALHEIQPLKLSGALQEVLAAIAAADGKAGLQKAKALAEKLTREEDVAHALAAYKKRVEALKEKAAAGKTETTPPTDQEGARGAIEGAPVVTYAVLADRLQQAANREAAAEILDAARTLQPAQQSELSRLADERWPGEG